MVGFNLARNRNADGGDDSDPYRLRKVQGSPNNNWLELQLNDDFDESFRIYGNSCAGFGCGEYSQNLYHSFDASGHAYHRGNVGIGFLNPKSKLVVYDAGNVGSNQLELRTNHLRNPDRYFMKNIIAGSGTGDMTFYLRHDGQMFVDGNIGIGIYDPKNKLDVNGSIHAKEVKVDMSGWADYVFKKGYNLPALDAVEKHIAEKGHLPGIPSEKEVVENGISLGDMNRKLLQKIEELTLYSIE